MDGTWCCRFSAVCPAASKYDADDYDVALPKAQAHAVQLFISVPYCYGPRPRGPGEREQENVVSTRTVRAPFFSLQYRGPLARSLSFSSRVLFGNYPSG